MTTIYIFTAHCSLWSPFSFKEFFWCEPFLKYLLDLLHHCFCFMFRLFGCEACGILDPWPGIKPISPVLEGKVLIAGLPGKSKFVKFFNMPPCWFLKATSCTVVVQALLRNSQGNSASQRASDLLNRTQRWSSVQSPQSRVRILQYFSPCLHGLVKGEESQARKEVSMRTRPNGIWPWLWDGLRQVSLQPSLVR